ncbi:Hsp20/alpha crystallin family protein [Desulfosudis oleivorans]|uniref:Heat shock protein Hsp20 n=1 Tax=Desulfosudis oleivorans (strain DSM 6200 / JCM 39069 / Hxd3) TaxID=96561 RepID=A8ZW92_DESOH|nr:Hsp20/alpha crystallin family protein [Desulfosudis oleivorans]ABW68326.1 heat shock protein Hsp20 [Desulfosudis oleivorans Hxd3]
MYNTFLPSLINREWAADDNAYFGNIVDSLWKSFDLPAVFSEKGEWSPAIDVSETEAAYLVKAELPGLDKEAIDISINDGVLTVSGEKKMETREEKENYILTESRCGSFSRSFTLPADASTDNVDATFTNGVLTISVPKSEAARPRKIKVS